MAPIILIQMLWPIISVIAAWLAITAVVGYIGTKFHG